MPSQNTLPFDVLEAAVSVAGRAFHFKSGLRALFLRCGVPHTMYDRHASETKFVIARCIFADLEAKGALGYKIATAIIEEMCSIRHISDDNVDKVSAKEAIDNLRKLAKSALLETAREEITRRSREESEATRLATIAQRATALSSLYAQYIKLLSEKDKQKRRFALEEILKELFVSHELEYRPSYKATAQQIDGAFRFEKFDYLVEIKWTAEESNLAELLIFRGKVESKMQSTRGLFLSMSGFREDVVEEFQRGSGRSVILMDGEDLALILEGRFELSDALELKTSKAAQEGVIFARLREHL